MLFAFLLIVGMVACSKNEDPEAIEGKLYFPPVGSSEWSTVSVDSLGWDITVLDDLYTFLEENGTRAFIILKDGKIVTEQYWGENILGTGSFMMSSQWYWASAGKSLTAFLVGIAQQEDLLNINDKTSDYLGLGWSSLSEEKENLITIRHHLTMTTGLDYTSGDLDCTDPECLHYKADAGEQWYYHNAAYTLLEGVVSAAGGQSYNSFTDQRLEAATGMNGTWIKSGYRNIYYSTARDMARFGLLVLNKGKWSNIPVLKDQNYYTEMINTSQNLNLSYGYLWWLNGKSSIIIPGLTVPIKTMAAPKAPEDMFVAAGKNGQFIDVIPSENIVVVRMGEAPDEALVPIQFHNDMWAKIAELINFR